MSQAFPAVRKSERLPITLEVNFKTELEFLNSKTRNISAGGMFIRTFYPLPEGTELNVRFSIPEIEVDFSVVAKVVWSAVVRESEDESGMGINFLNMSEEKSEILKNYIEKKLGMI
ncbi:MAG: TIGR02266 family protein [Deltaproteobacteria bacterium]|nr:TIGR02266 family protein [Deltaproteobacteria bacterium]